MPIKKHKGLKTPGMYMDDIDVMCDKLLSLIPQNPIILSLARYEDLYERIKNFKSGLACGSASPLQRQTALREAQDTWLKRMCNGKVAHKKK